MQMQSRMLLFILVIITIIYIKLSLRPKDYFQILQMESRQLTPDHIFEKQPIVLTDNVCDILALLHTTFQYTYMWKHFDMNFKTINKNKSQYLIINIISESASILIEHPHIERYEGVELKLDKDQILILPYGWGVVVKEGETKSVHLDTIITTLIKPFV